MSTELTMLVLSAILCVALTLPYTQGIASKFGFAAAAGNRDDLPALTGWMGRAQRAHANMVENLVPFAAVVLAAQVAGKNGALTALGAQLFFWFRLAHAVVYIVGIPYLRTLVWLVSVVGMALIVVAFFS
jgi:uncharacterized MAPEG superfamily protein